VGSETYSLYVDESGSLRIKGDEADYLILPATTVSKIGSRLYKIVGEAANVQLAEIGRSIGHSLAELIKRQMHGDRIEDIIESIDDYLSKSGFGKAELVKHENHFDVIINNPPSLRHAVEGLKKCRFEAGLIKGILEEITGKKWHVQVDDSVNQEKCLIHVKPME